MSKILIQIVILLFSINLIVCANENGNKVVEDNKKVVNVVPEDTHTEQSIFPVDRETEHLNITSKFPIPKWMKETDGIHTGFFILSVLVVVVVVWIGVRTFRYEQLFFLPHNCL